MKASNKYYPLQVWLLTIVLAPLLLLLMKLTVDGLFMGDGLLKGLLFFVLFGAVYSIPAFGLFYLSYKLLLRQGLRVLTMKLILFALAALLTFLTYLIIVNRVNFFRYADWNDLSLPAIYYVAILFSCLLYRVTRKPG